MVSRCIAAGSRWRAGADDRLDNRRPPAWRGAVSLRPAVLLIVVLVRLLNNANAMYGRTRSG